MIKSHIHNLELLHDDHTDLLTEEEKSIYLFLKSYVEKAEKIFNDQGQYDNYAYHRLNNGDYLFLYANDTLDIPVQLFIYNVKTDTFEDKVTFDRIRILSKEFEQEDMNATLKGLNKQVLKQTVMPEINQRLYERARQTQEIHQQNYTGWEENLWIQF